MLIRRLSAATVGDVLRIALNTSAPGPALVCAGSPSQWPQSLNNYFQEAGFISSAAQNGTCTFALNATNSSLAGGHDVSAVKVVETAQRLTPSLCFNNAELTALTLAMRNSATVISQVCLLSPKIGMHALEAC